MKGTHKHFSPEHRVKFFNFKATVTSYMVTLAAQSHNVVSASWARKLSHILPLICHSYLTKHHIHFLSLANFEKDVWKLCLIAFCRAETSASIYYESGFMLKWCIIWSKYYYHQKVQRYSRYCFQNYISQTCPMSENLSLQTTVESPLNEPLIWNRAWCFKKTTTNIISSFTHSIIYYTEWIRVSFWQILILS